MPHKDVHDVNNELQTPRFKWHISENNFKTSLKCNSCDLSITYQDHAKVLWLIKWHVNNDSHIVKTRWYLDGANKAHVSKPKVYLVTRPTFASSTFMAFIAVPSKTSLGGFPLLETYTESSIANSMLLKRFLLGLCLAPSPWASLLGFSLLVCKI